MWDVIQNRRVLFGAGVHEQIPSIVRHGGRVFALAFDADAECVRDILRALDRQNVAYDLDASLTGEPSVPDVDRIANRVRAGDFASVLAIGGGSVLDTAKAVALLATNEGTVTTYQMEGRVAERPALPLIAVPTTSGTGSEATKVSVVYNPDNGLKKSFYSPYMIADTVVLDPLLTTGMPRAITVSTGVDALSHAIESYVSLNATDYTQAFSLRSMKLAVESLERCADEPGDVEARGKMLLASYFGGCALNAGIGLAHMIAQPLGGLLKIPHGVACAIYLPHAMRYNADYCTDRYCDVARVFGETGENSEALAQRGIERVQNFLTRLNAPTSIRAYAGSAFDLDGAVAVIRGATGHILCNPRPVTAEAIRDVVRASLEGSGK